MKYSKRFVVLFIVFFASFLASELVKAESVTVILTRHLEKSTNDKRDPDLSEEGKIHAQALYKLLENQPINRFFSTPYKRTNQTLELLANAQKKEIETYSPKNHQELITQIKQLKNEVIMISGHSNTIPDLLNLFLGTKTYQEMDESRYGDLWIITLFGEGESSVTQLRF